MARRRPLRKVVIDDTDVSTRDGVPLATDVIRLDGSEQRPALLIRSPYGRAFTRQIMDVTALARQGWGVVVQDARGRGDSGGIFNPFAQEADDGHDAVAWCARQPWCDGRVAMSGASYLGYAQWAAADAPELKAIAPTTAATSLFDKFYDGGAQCMGLMATWTAMMAATDPHANKRALARASKVAADWQALTQAAPADHPLRALMPVYEHWLDPDDKRYWSAVDVSGRFSAFDVAAFHVAGWYDVFCESGIRAWQGMRTHASSEYARASQRLLIGPWSHISLYLQASPELDFGPAANGYETGIPLAQIEWLREAVDGKEVQGGVRLFVMGSNEWREHSHWPPPSTATDLYLAATTTARSLRGDGRLLPTNSELAGADRFLHDPENPVPTRGGRILGPWLPVAGPCDQRPVEERDDVLVYTSDVLKEDVTVIGSVRASVVFETTGYYADITAKLVDVHPDGRAFNVVDSIRRSKFVPARARTVEIDLGSTAQTFLRGHRIRLEIASSNFPKYDRNWSTDVKAAQVHEYQAATQTVYRGGRARSRLTLPVVDGTLP